MLHAPAKREDELGSNGHTYNDARASDGWGLRQDPPSGWRLSGTLIQLNGLTVSSEWPMDELMTSERCQTDWIMLSQWSLWSQNEERPHPGECLSHGLSSYITFPLSFPILLLFSLLSFKNRTYPLRSTACLKNRIGKMYLQALLTSPSPHFVPVSTSPGSGMSSPR